jgi:hypothetical protein
MILAVAAEEIANFRPRHPGLTGLPECCGDHIFSFLGDNAAEDVVRRGVAVTPDRKGCMKVRNVYLVSSVEERIEEREADGLRFCPAENGTQETGLTMG